jgi:putative flavoprotein involved in K+ transport
VVVVGGGNSAAQLLAEVSTVAATTWVTPRPRFPPDDVDGRVLFDVASACRAALAAGRGDPGGVAALGDMVMIPAVDPIRHPGRRGLGGRQRAARPTPSSGAPGSVPLWCTWHRCC